MGTNLRGIHLSNTFRSYKIVSLQKGNNCMVWKINENEGKLDPVDAEDLRA